jgi:hypothetical protein
MRRTRDGDCASLEGAGATVADVRYRGSTLEDVFLETTGLALEGQGAEVETALARLHDHAGG